jgi:hypothetical protein
MSENVNGMQTMLNVFSEYYNTWKLQVNIAKTKWLYFQKVKLLKMQDLCLTTRNYIPSTFSDIRTVSAAYNKRNILR